MSEDFRRAKIVATIGPASDDPETFASLVEAGADAVRVNFSHAAHEGAGETISMARDLARRRGRPLAVVADLQGPRIRVGDLKEPLTIREGETYRFVPERDATAGAAESGREKEGTLPQAATAAAIPTTYDQLAEDLSPGDLVLLDDGRLEFEVQRVSHRVVWCVACSQGTLLSQKGMNLPGVSVHAPSLTEKDLEDLRFARSRRVDYVALSFVRQPEDLRQARAEMDPGNLLIAKIEKDQALERLAEVIELSDAVMVARGDLGVELPYEEVPLVQKQIILQAVERARPVITATQMLESMKTAQRPTRAEVSDVANALLDGTDAVMLSGETAVGSYPVQAVQTMDRIIRRIEQEEPGLFSRVRERPPKERARIQQTTSGAVAAASLQAVERLDSPFICTFTRSGFTARVMSAQRPPVPILALTDQWRSYNQLALVWGVVPILFRGEVGYEKMLESVKKVAVERGFGQVGQPFVLTAGVPFHVSGTTNMVRIEEL